MMDSFTPVVHQEWIKYKKTPDNINTFSRKYFLVLIDNRVELKENEEDYSKPKKTLPITDIGSSKSTENIVIITYLKDRKWRTMYFHCVSAVRAQIINQYILQAMNYNKFIPNKLNSTEERPNERDTLSPLKKTLSYGANNIKSKRKLKPISLHSEPMLPEIKKQQSPDLPHSGRRRENFTRIDDSPKTNKEARVISPSLPKRPRPKTKLESSFKDNKSKLVPLNMDDPSPEFLNHSTPNSTSSLVLLPSLSLSSPESNQLFPLRSNSNPTINSTISQPYSPITMTPPLSGYFSLNPSYKNDNTQNNLFNVSENQF